MTADGRRTFLRHLLALDLMIVAAGVGYLAPGSPEILFGAFLAAVALAAWMGGDEVGLAATAYAVVTLSLLFPAATDVGALTAFAATGAVLSTIVRVVNIARATARPVFEPVTVARPDVRPTMGLAFGLPLLIVVMYTDISDILMRKAPVPSLLQPLILLLTVAVFRARRVLRPATAALQPVVFAFAAYALVVFATSVWARDARAVDDTFSEIVKALFICVLTASLAASWGSLERALAALTATATVLATTSLIQITTGRFMDAFLGLVTPQSGTIYDRIAMPRASGPPNSDPNFYARILLIVIPLAIGLGIAAKTTRRRILFFGAAAIITAGTLVTYSRGAMVALVFTAVLMLVMFRVPAKRVALMVAAAAVVLLLLPKPITARFVSIETLVPDEETAAFTYDSAVEKRKVLVRAGLAMFAENPILGVGAGNYSRAYFRMANEIGSPFVDYHPPGTTEYPHGLYFAIAAETGLLGLLAFGATAVAALLTVERSRRAVAARGRADLAALTLTVGVSIASYLVASIVLHETHYRYPALLFGFAIAVARLVRGEVAEAQA